MCHDLWWMALYGSRMFVFVAVPVIIFVNATSSRESEMHFPAKARRTASSAWRVVEANLCRKTPERCSARTKKRNRHSHSRIVSKISARVALLGKECRVEVYELPARAVTMKTTYSR